MPPSGERTDPPKSLDWYRQAANWLVGLSTGGLLLMTSLIGDVRDADRWTSLSFALAGLAFLLSVICGVLFYLHVLTLGNTIERLAEISLGDEATSQDKEKRQKLETKKERAEHWFLLFYRGVLLFFPIGLLFTAAVLVLTIVERPPPPNGFVVVNGVRSTLAGEADTVSLLVDVHEGRSWVLRSTEAGQLRWEPVQIQSRDGGSAP